MINKILIIFFFLFAGTQSNVVIGNQYTERYCAPQLQEAFALIQQMPEAQEVLDKIQKQGGISIELNHHISKKFEGYWSPEDRTIYITPGQSKAGCIVTILFEMHNAVHYETLDYYDTLAYNQQISKKEYVRSVEYWEYQNAIATTAILNKGIEMGLFPRECYWPLHDNFEEHFQLQKSTGHSAHIGQMYDSLI
ncbi:MAG: hypothetical protein P0S96_00900 [Simkaniaceae bacterium]|nr:hypothetical protein [Candidatus Sacchlamyda saccharinae]